MLHSTFGCFICIVYFMLFINYSVEKVPLFGIIIYLLVYSYQYKKKINELNLNPRKLDFFKVFYLYECNK